MSLNISEATNATAQNAVSRSPVQAGHNVRRPAGQGPDGSDATPKPRNLADTSDTISMRAHPAAGTDDSLQRLPETHEQSRGKNRVRKDAGHGAEHEEVHLTARKPRSPYDPPAFTRRHVDIMA